MSKNEQRNGAILYVDIVGYSKAAAVESQMAMTEMLEREVRRFLPAHWWQPPAPDAVFIPTGDGFMLTLKAQHADDNQRMTCLAVALYIHLAKFCRGWTFGGHCIEVQLHGGLHFGPYYTRLDVTGRANVTGSELAVAQRIFSFASEQHFLLSVEAIKLVLKSCGITETRQIQGSEWVQLSKLAGLLVDVCNRFDVPHDRHLLGDGEEVKVSRLEDRQDKHGIEYEVWNLFVMHQAYPPHENDPTCRVGEHEPPLRLIPLSYIQSKRPKEVELARQKFINNLAGAKEFILVGVMHEHTLAVLNKAMEERHGRKWDRVTIIFPDKHFLENVYEGEKHRSKPERLRAAVANRKKIQRWLNSDIATEFSVMIFGGAMPFTGTYFVPEADGQKKYLRITLVLPWRDLCHGIWFDGKEGDVVFEEYGLAFKEIVDHSQFAP